MTQRYFILLLFFVAKVMTVDAQYRLIEKITKTNDKLAIPYEKYVFDNGLTVILHQDASDPIVHVDVTYHVGSAREEISKSGFAHFFEHMMFQGSENVGDEEHFRIITEAGGTLNGTTSRDRTNYFETLPKNQLEIALWLEADRMGFLLDAVTQKKFEIQRETVKNERGQRYDNRPYGLAGENMAKSLYPYGHPYSWLTIGYIEDLNRVDVDDLKDFFKRWYGPNNAVLTIGGDIDTKTTLKMIQKYFGSIPKGPAVEDMNPIFAEIDNNRYVSYEDNYIRTPQLHIVYPAVPAYHKDEAPLDCLSEILGHGKTSIFYKNLEKQKKALFSYAGNPAYELAGEFMMIARPMPGVGLEEIVDIIDASLKEFEEKGVDDDALARFKAEYESRTINSLQSVSGKVSKLASYETLLDNPNQIQNDLDRYLSITKEDIIRVYEKYIKNKPRVILSVLPKGQKDSAAGKDNYTVSKEDYIKPKSEYEGLIYNKAKDIFDRSKKPQPGVNPVINIPSLWKESFDNGLQIIGTKNDEIPSVTLFLRIKGGHLHSANAPEKAGISELTATMMNEATKNYTAEEFSNELKKLGSSISVSSQDESVTIVLNSLTKNLSPTLKLLEERIFNTVFEESTFQRLKGQQLETIKNQNTKPETIANRVFAKLTYGDEIKSIPALGTEETVNNISLDDVKSFYKNYYDPSVSSMVIVGDINKEEVMPQIDFLKSWKKKNVKIPTISTGNPIDKTKIYLVNVDDAAQSQILMGYRIDFPYDVTGDYYKSYLMNYTLGGAFNSRINLNLREDKGYTYGARSYFSSSNIPGRFIAKAQVKKEATDSAVFEFIKEIKNFKEKGITDVELNFMKNSIGQRDALKYETLHQKAGFLNKIIQYGLDSNYPKQQEKILQNITTNEINEIAKKRLLNDQMHIVVVGDKKIIGEGLKRLGYDIIELSKEGEVID